MRRGAPPGQATVEYSLATGLLLAALLVVGTAPLLEAPGKPPQSLWQTLQDAYRSYYGSYFYLLRQPFP